MHMIPWRYKNSNTQLNNYCNTHAVSPRGRCKVVSQVKGVLQSLHTQQYRMCSKNKRCAFHSSIYIFKLGLTNYNKHD
jgi:hypothetical protein